MKKGNIVVIVLAVLAIVIVSFDIVYYLSHFTNFENAADKVGNAGEKVEKSSPAEARKENLQISDDVVRVTTILNQYQANNRGSIPVIGSTGSNSWEYFEGNYLNGCNENINECYKFSDTYTLEVCDYTTGQCKDPNLLNWDADKYVIYATTRAECRGKNGIVANKGARKVAIYAVMNPADELLENPFVCVNN